MLGTIQRYQLLEPVGQGAYGVVFSAVDKLSGESFAVKKITDIFQDSQDAKRTLREVKLLRHFKDLENIINIRELLPNKRDFKNLYIVMELMDKDLTQLTRDQTLELSIQDIKILMYQVIRGLKFIHAANVVHRDLRPKNLLLKGKSIIKIADLGMGRAKSVNMSYLEYTTTMWYRAPEGFFPSLGYSGAVDVWSVACIISELIGGKILVKGKDEKEQLENMFKTFGSPPENFLNSLKKADKKLQILSGLSQNIPKIPLITLLPRADSLAIDLLEKMFILDPNLRITAAEALNHPWFVSFQNLYSFEPKISTFSFDENNETDNMTSEQIRDALYEEIKYYHQEEK